MPGPELAEALAATDPQTLDVEACMSYAKACDQLSSWSQAQVGLALVAAREPVLRATGESPLTDTSAHVVNPGHGTNSRHFCISPP